MTGHGSRSRVFGLEVDRVPVRFPIYATFLAPKLIASFKIFLSI